MTRTFDPVVRHLDLFSGIGGFALACRMVGGIETVAFCEIEPFAQKVLAKNFPGIPIHGDIHTLKGTEYGTVDLITGGYPCQPFSTAGRRMGDGDDRHLWPELRRIVEAARPRWVLCENVAGHVSLGLDQVLSELDSIGYACGAVVIPACAVNACHRRDRVWIIANALPVGGERLRNELGQPCAGGQGRENHAEAGDMVSADSCGFGQSGQGRTKGRRDSEAHKNREADEPFAVCGWPVVSPVRGKHDGVSRKLDCDRLRGLGNAIVPQVAAEILKAMMQADRLANPSDEGRGTL